jgi:hypothetical protein
VVAGTDDGKIRAAVAAWDAALSRGETDFAAGIESAFGDGAASGRIVAQILEFLQARTDA